MTLGHRGDLCHDGWNWKRTAILSFLLSPKQAGKAMVRPLPGAP
jgi:hypothetical protein